ncbi:MAG: hypothetical protein COC06_07615 [Bacteroidales bacterium]|nr:MAG: hypothetical protein COC06_07615 [Bacteroidales bacterium]
MKLSSRIKVGLYNAISEGKALVKSKPNQNKIIAKILQETKDTSRKDIQVWRKALEATMDVETPRYADYHDLIDDLATDGHLHSQIQIRKLATLSSNYNIIDKKSGKEIPEKTELLKASWFYDFIDRTLEYVFRGYEVLELVDTGNIRFEVIPRRNIVPEQKLMLFEATGDKGIRYNDPNLAKYIIEVGEVGSLGILNNIIPQLIWKKNAQQSWAEYSEKFGMPLITATTNKSDTKSLDKIEEQISSMGEAGSAVLPEGTTIEIKESSAKDAFNVYDRQIERTNSEISKQILGGTMVSDSGSSRAQSEVHERTLDNKIAEADRRFVEFLINDKLIPILQVHGHPFNENDKFVFDRSQSIPLKDHWKIVSEALKEYDIPDEWISKTFRFPVNGRKKKDEGNFKKPQTGQSTAEAKYNFPTANSLPEAHTFIAQGDGISKVLDKYQDTILGKLYKGENCDQDVLQKAIEVGKWLRSGLFEGWGKRRLNIGYNEPDHKALAYMEYNLFHFSHARELAGLAKINELLIDKDKLKIRSFSDFKTQATPFLTKFNDTWLKTEYDFSIAVGQNASAYNRFLSEKETVTRYIQYQTVGDSQVRSEHALLDGLIFDIDDVEARRIWPPNAWKCRCEFIQYLGKPAKITKGKDAIKLLEDELGSSQKKIMLKNRGDIGEVFTFDQFYMAYKEKDFNKRINSLLFGDYKLKAYKDIKADFKNLKLDSSITGDNVKELFKKEGNASFMGFKDYLNRKMILKESVFKKHISGKYLTEAEQRHKLFPHVKDVLNTPDEVYLHEFKKEKYQLRYIKFYKDKILCADAIVKNTGVEINTWYESKKGDDVRRGLLIK